MSEQHTERGVERVALDALDGTGRPFADDGEPEVVRLGLDAGESVAPHSHPGRNVVFFVLDGAFDVHLDGDSHRVETGECLRFDGEREVSPQATDEGAASALVVLAKR